MTGTDAAQEALALWEERQRRRVEFLATPDDVRESLAREADLDRI